MFVWVKMAGPSLAVWFAFGLVGARFVFLRRLQALSLGLLGAALYERQ